MFVKIIKKKISIAKKSTLKNIFIVLRSIIIDKQYIIIVYRLFFYIFVQN